MTFFRTLMYRTLLKTLTKPILQIFTSRFSLWLNSSVTWDGLRWQKHCSTHLETMTRTFKSITSSLETSRQSLHACKDVFIFYVNKYRNGAPFCERKFMGAATCSVWYQKSCSLSQSHRPSTNIVAIFSTSLVIYAQSYCLQWPTFIKVGHDIISSKRKVCRRGNIRNDEDRSARHKFIKRAYCVVR